MADNPAIVGIDELRQRLYRAQDKLVRDVDRELRDGSQAIVAEAKQRAPGDQGTLRQQIDYHQVEALRYEITSNAEYSPYIEFGTMEKVRIPDGLEEYAAQFKGNFASGLYSEANGLTAKEAIFAWCQRKGIDEKLWYPIYVSIMVHGITPQPFFFPAFNRISPIINDRVQKVVATALNK